VENVAAAKNAVSPLPHHVSHNIGLTPFTNLSSGRKDNRRVAYPVDGGSSLLWSFDADLSHHIPGDCRISNDQRQNLKLHLHSSATASHL